MSSSQETFAEARTFREAERKAGAIDWLEKLSATQVSPAAGSAAALAGALGVALLSKLACRTQPQRIGGYDRLLDRLLTARDRLAALAEADASAITA